MGNGFERSIDLMDMALNLIEIRRSAYRVIGNKGELTYCAGGYLMATGNENHYHHESTDKLQKGP
jgi:hypothetical protein